MRWHRLSGSARQQRLTVAGQRDPDAELAVSGRVGQGGGGRRAAAGSEAAVNQLSRAPERGLEQVDSALIRARGRRAGGDDASAGGHRGAEQAAASGAQLGLGDVHPGRIADLDAALGREAIHGPGSVVARVVRRPRIDQAVARHRHRRAERVLVAGVAGGQRLGADRGQRAASVAPDVNAPLPGERARRRVTGRPRRHVRAVGRDRDRGAEAVVVGRTRRAGRLVQRRLRGPAAGRPVEHVDRPALRAAGGREDSTDGDDRAILRDRDRVSELVPGGATRGRQHRRLVCRLPAVRPARVHVGGPLAAARARHPDDHRRPVRRDRDRPADVVAGSPVRVGKRRRLEELVGRCPRSWSHHQQRDHCRQRCRRDHAIADHPAPRTFRRALARERTPPPTPSRLLLRQPPI